MPARLEEMTPHSLAQLSELEFERAERVISYQVSQGHPRAKWLEECIDAVVARFDTYEPEFVDALDDCPYTQSHTRHWCGRLFCRDS